MNIDEFLPHQYCVNLESRPDRWERVQSRLAEHDIERMTRFPALDGRLLEIPSGWGRSPGAYGCLRSHLALVEQARAESWPTILIFEDDVVLAPDFRKRFADGVRQLPEDWDMLFFGAIHGQPVTRVGSNLIRVHHSLSTYAYALKHTVYDAFIELNRTTTSLLDENTRALQKYFKCYCFLPHLAWVEEDYSDVQSENVDLWWLKESLVLFGPEMDEVMRNTAVTISYRHENERSLRNLAFNINHLAKGLPGSSILIAERGSGRRLKDHDLPSGCVAELVLESGHPSLDSSLNQVLEQSGQDRTFFVFLDSDVFINREDMRGNLLKCCDYDLASGFRDIYHLDSRDTLRILEGDEGWNYDKSRYEVRTKDGLCDLSYITTRKGLSLLARAEGDSLNNRAQSFEKLETGARIYRSPNRARRLACS